jgi:hypothetical protein
MNKARGEKCAACSYPKLFDVMELALVNNEKLPRKHRSAHFHGCGKGTWLCEECENLLLEGIMMLYQAFGLKRNLVHWHRGRSCKGKARRRKHKWVVLDAHRQSRGNIMLAFLDLFRQYGQIRGGRPTVTTLLLSDKDGHGRACNYALKKIKPEKMREIAGKALKNALTYGDYP